jgi:hypothetical protein
MTAPQGVVAAVRITDVYHALTGARPRRTGPHTARGPAVWRGGVRPNVSLDDARGVWHDFAAGEGGGVLNLVRRVRGGSRRDALRWLAGYAGIALRDGPASAADRARWAEERRATERDLPAARYWRRAAVEMAEDLLMLLKAGLFDPVGPRPEIGEIADVERTLARLRGAGDRDVVAEYRWWRDHYPGMTEGMVRAARARERAERRAVLRYLREVTR